MQEMHNKDVEEIKNSQSVQNNAIPDIKNTLGGNKQYRKWGRRINDLEDRMVEINAAEWKKEE